MIPSRAQIEALHHKYAANDTLYHLVYDHCRAVADIALWCADQVPDDSIDKGLLEAASLLHDIGSYGFMTEEGKIANHRTYAQHAFLGAQILRDEGVNPRIAGIVETHVQLGWSKEEIVSLGLALPPRNLTPHSEEAEILCYADRFHSKAPKFNKYETYVAFLQDIFPTQVEKFQKASKKFGLPDLRLSADKYGHPIV